MTGSELMELTMKKYVSIGFELDDNRRYDSLARRLHHHGAVLVLPMQWFLETKLEVDEVKRDLQAYLDPADRLLVTEVNRMSSRNLINADKIDRGAA
jgi:hypothetical protein